MILHLLEHLNEKNNLDIKFEWSDSQVEEYILTRYKENGYSLYNLYLCIKYRSNHLSMKKINDFDEKCLEDLTYNERAYRIMEYYSKIMINIINEMVTSEANLDSNKSIWVVVGLGNLYGTNLISFNKKYLIKDLLDNKIKNSTLIISTLKRDPEIIFFTKNKKNFLEKKYPKELIENIKFVRGFKICISPLITSELWKLRYNKKPYKSTYVDCIYKGNNTVGDFIKNSKYNKKVWIKDYIDMGTDNFLQTNIEPKIVDILNYLGSTPLHINKEIFTYMKKLSIKTIESISIEKLKINIQNNKFYEVEKRLGISTLGEHLDIKKNIQSVGIFELIRRQINDIIKYCNNTFFLNYVLDERCRIYADSWPINYQLNHTIRGMIEMDEIKYPNKILENFKNNEFLKKYLNMNKCFIFSEKFSASTKKEIKSMISNPEIEELEEEMIIMIISSLAPKNINNTEVRFLEGIKMSKELIDLDVIDFAKKYEIEERDIYPLISIRLFCRSIKWNSEHFSRTVWLDASSNSLQLASYRLGETDELLLEKLNIYNNESEDVNIYDFITRKINEIDHNEFLKSINNIISIDDFLKLNRKKDNKRRTMPASYGKTLYTCIKEDNKIFQEDEMNIIWKKIDKEYKIKISAYFWKLNRKILSNLGLDLDRYKKLFNKCIKRYWMNDYNLPIIINNKKYSNRNEIVSKIDFIKFQIKKVIEEGSDFYIHKNSWCKKEDIINTFKEKILKLEKTLKEDEKTFYSRNVIWVNKEKITLRVEREINELNIKDIHKSLIPSSIHSYDSSIIMKCVEICKILGIRILIIHDSIGCSAIYAPLVRLIFVSVNYFYLEQSMIKAPYPLVTPIKEIPKKEKMLKSKNIFRI